MDNYGFKSKQVLKQIFFSILFCGAIFLISRQTFAEPFDSIYVDEIDMVIGELNQILVYDLERISVSNPQVFDVVEAEDQEVMIVAQDVGNAILFLWDKNGKRAININVFSHDLEFNRQRIEKLLQNAGIFEIEVEPNSKEGMVMVSGSIPDHKKDMFNQIITPFEERGELISVVSELISEDLVQIDMQITELTQTLTENLGVDWRTGVTEESDGDGGVNEFITARSLSPAFTEAIPVMDSFSDWFKIGDFQRTQQFQFVINALIEKGKGRILSKPKLVVKSGDEATFLVGGEIPIRTTTTSTSGSSQENIEFKNYGIGMTITPTVTKGKVDILLNTEISEIDRANAVQEDVAFTTRTAQTRLFLNNEQTIIMAGLIKKSEGETIKKVPFLGDVPVLGYLFRNKRKITPDEDTEIIISLKPTILQDTMSDDAVEMKMDDELAGKYENLHLTKTLTPELAEEWQDPNVVIPANPYASLPQEMIEYVQDIQTLISSQVVYPEEAKAYGLEGTVKVGLSILRDGTLDYAMIQESSGYDLFDNDILEIAKASAPYFEFPEESELEEINVTIPIVYSINPE